MEVRIESLHVYPVKSCAGHSLEEIEITEKGFAHDREWVIVHADGRFVSQRDKGAERMAVIRPRLETDALVLEYPGRPALRVPYSSGELVSFTVHEATLSGHDQGDAASRWLSEIFEFPVRLVRCAPEDPRTAPEKYSGGVRHRVAGQDAFPLLVTSTSSLDAFNAELAAEGVDPVPMTRFRANVVVSGLPPFAEEADVKELRLEGGLRLLFVKPCGRCKIINVDQETGAFVPAEGRHRILRTLAKNHVRVGSSGKPSAIFGQNALVIDANGAPIPSGSSKRLRVGARGQAG